MSDLVDVEVESQISKLQHTQFELEMKLCGMCEGKYARLVSTIDMRIEQIEFKIKSMEERIRKKQRNSWLPPLMDLYRWIGFPSCFVVTTKYSQRIILLFIHINFS